MNALLQQIRRTIRRHELCPPGARLAVGLSGGSDSVALTLLLRDLAATSGFSIATLVHFNHRLRSTAERDERFCRELAAALSLPIAVAAVDVHSYAAGERLSVEDAARRARYAFLHGAARDAGADRIAVGHTRDDQAETVLLKLVRGAGASGLGGIYPRRGIVIRPLLGVTRAELRTYLRERRQAWVDDESNDDVVNPRNRIRHRVLPELERAYPGAAQSIARAAAVTREDGLWLDGLANRRYEALAVEHSGCVEFEAAALLAEPPPLQRRIVLATVRRLAPGREIGLEHIDTALDVLGGESAGADLPGCRVELRRRKLVLLSRGGQNRGLEPPTV